MSKDPAILFYYQDFMYGTRRFTREQRGLYIELICEQADSKTGSISENEFNEICNSDNDEPVKRKFTQDADGFYNKKLREVVEKRKKFTESRRKNLSSKKEKSHKVIHKEPHMGDNMENENRNEIKDVNNKKRCLMKNSGVTVKDIKKAFQTSGDLIYADPAHYYTTALDWSDGDNKMRTDWVAVIRNFARSDIKNGKMKVKKKTRNEVEKVDDNFNIVSETATQMPTGMADRLKKSIDNIGKKP